MRFGLGELFCGPGGLGWGAVHADIGLSDWGIDHVWATDYDAMTCETYRKNLCPDSMDSVFCQDVRELDMSSLPDISALAFGFPCNDFSTVGEQKGFAGTGRISSCPCPCIFRRISVRNIAGEPWATRFLT